MKSVCIIGAKNLKSMTLISLYTCILEKRRIPYDIVYIDYDGVDEFYPGCRKLYKFVFKNKKRNSFLNRINTKLNTIRYRKFIKQIVKRNYYSFLVFWGDEAGSLLSIFLSTKKKIKYSMNIRDLWNLDDKKHTKSVFDAIKSSSFCTVSSEAFLKHLPPSRFFYVPSLNKKLLGNIIEPTNSDGFISKNTPPYVITTIGAFRNDSYNKRLVDIFANDNRYILKFIGKGSGRMMEYCRYRSYNNVICIDSFEPNQTIDYLKDASIINCAYGSDNIAEKTKLPIRLYYAVSLFLPVMATFGTWIQEVADKLGICISIPPEGDLFDSNIANVVLQKYKELDKKAIDKNLRNYFNEIEDNQSAFEKEFLAQLEIS